MKRFLAALLTLFVLSGAASAAPPDTAIGKLHAPPATSLLFQRAQFGGTNCTQWGGYPWVQGGCLNATDLDAALNNSPNNLPPANAFNSGAGFGKFWIDTSPGTITPVLRQCVNPSGCAPNYVTSDWLNWGTYNTSTQSMTLSVALTGFTATQPLQLSGGTLSLNYNGAAFSVSAGALALNLVSPALGGTGVNNGTRTITLGANFATTGAGALTFAAPVSAATYTLPGASDSLAGLATNQTFTGVNVISLATLGTTLTVLDSNGAVIDQWINNGAGTGGCGTQRFPGNGNGPQDYETRSYSSNGFVNCGQAWRALGVPPVQFAFHAPPGGSVAAHIALYTDEVTCGGCFIRIAAPTGMTPGYTWVLPSTPGNVGMVEYTFSSPGVTKWGYIDGQNVLLRINNGYGIVDANAVSLVVFNTAASAQNFFLMSNAANGSAPLISTGTLDAEQPPLALSGAGGSPGGGVKLYAANGSTLLADFEAALETHYKLAQFNLNLQLLGTSTGYVVLTTANTGASNFTITFPAATDTVALLAATQALTNKTYNGLTVTSTTGALTIAAGKTLTDTSGPGAVLLLGATGGGFTGYGGSSCTNQVVTAISTAGAGTCNSITNAYLTAGAFTQITGVGTIAQQLAVAFAIAGGAGFTVNDTSATNGATLAGFYSNGVLVGSISNNTTIAGLNVTGPMSFNNATIKLTAIAAGAANDYVCWNSSSGVLTENASCGPSDPRLKTPFVYLATSEVVGGIMSLHPGKFNWLNLNDTGRGEQFGFNAQEVKAAFPDLAWNDGDRDIVLTNGEVRHVPGVIAFREVGLLVPLTLLAQLHEQRLNALENATASLAARVSALEALPNNKPK